MPESLTPLPPYEDYLRSLENADLIRTRMGREWKEAGERVFVSDSVPMDLPVSVTAVFEEDNPDAHAYRFDVLPGQKLSITGTILADGRIFTNLFIWRNERWDVIEASDSVIYINREFGEYTECLLRIQPELLVAARYSLTINTRPALLNPVSGAQNRDIGSVYGDPREGGRRSHEGVDIFAPRGTPVVAPAAGRISRIQETSLGGKVIWMRDRDRRQAYYFAHLDSQIVKAGRQVKPGDTLGLVGNTGNARNTPPHLHFGIYRRGSKDPMSYIRTLDMMDNSVSIDTALAHYPMRVAAERLNLRAGPSTENPVLRQLSMNEYVTVQGRSGDWVFVKLPDGQTGYLSRDLLGVLEPDERIQLAAGEPILTGPDSTAVPLSIQDESGEAAVLARWKEFTYIKLENDLTGWTFSGE